MSTHEQDDHAHPPLGAGVAVEVQEEHDGAPPGGFIESLLDPKALQWLMAAGGALLSLGVVIWLAVIGVFEEPINAAVGLGIANVSLLAAGVYMAARTHYRHAGRGVAMLACLLLPLNLWFYDAQGLITLDEGGHLWLPALVCCLVYAGVARLLKDSLFVYAAVAGVAMTGMLLLADSGVDRFWEIIMPSGLLVVLGALCVHAERLFPARVESPGNAAFTRDDFGLAFFRAGHVLLASGLSLLLGGRLVGHFYDPVFAGLGWFEAPDVATVNAVKFAAMVLAGVGAYVYAYSQLVVRAGKRFFVPAVLAMVWCGVIGADLVGIALTEQLVVGVFAVVGVGCQIAMSLTTKNRDKTTASAAEATDQTGLRTTLATTGILSSGVALGLALTQLVRGLYLADGPLAFVFGWEYAVATFLLAAAHGLNAWNRRREAGATPLTLFGLALLAFAGGMFAIDPHAGLLTLAERIAVLAVTPIALGGAAHALRDRQRQNASRAAEVTALVVTLLALPTLLLTATTATVVLFALLAVAYGLVAAATGRRIPTTLAAVMAAVAMVEAIVAYQLGVHLPILAASLVGLVAVVVDRFRPMENVAFTGRLGVVLGGVAGALFATNRLLGDEANAALLGMLAAQTVVGAVAAMGTRAGRGRRGLWLVGGLSLIFAGATLNAISVLTPVQRFEMLTVAAGAALLAAGHLSWRKEAKTLTECGKSDGAVDLKLWFGSLMCTVPMVLGLIGVRVWEDESLWGVLHNAGVLAVGLALLGSGVLCRLRATTLCGAATLTAYLVSLVALISVPDQLQNVAVYMMLGGGLLFGGAVLLSVYRDWLLSLPKRARDGEGVFAVLKWR